MTILFDPRRPVKPARPFAAGILPPELVSLDAPATSADRARLDAADAEWVAANGGPRRPWDLELRSVLRSLAYPPCNVTEIVGWVADQGRADGCPVLDPEDRDTVNQFVARHLADAAADAADGGEIECDPKFWPAWTDLHHFEPTAADRAWWADESARMTAARVERQIDRRADRGAAESAALAAMERGLVPSDVAAEIARTTLVGHDD